jgi:hypothetical protein
MFSHTYRYVVRLDDSMTNYLCSAVCELEIDRE